MRRLVPCLAASLLALALAPVSRAQTGRWRVHAVEHARSEGVPEARLIADGDADARVDMSWMFFVARRGARVVLVDVGTDRFVEPRGRGERRSWRVTRAVPVIEALARLELSPDDVTDVVLTHHHWDHVDALGRYPTARVHAHRREWSRLPAALRVPVERSRRLSLARDGALFDGFTLRTVGAHTRAQRMVEIDCAEGRTILASDAAYLFRNLEERRAVAVTASPARNLAALEQAAARAPGRVIPGHDPAVFTRFPSTDGVATLCR